MLVLSIVGVALGMANLLGGKTTFGGSTSDDWNVGKALSVTGTSTLSGTVNASGNVNFTGDESRVSSLVFGSGTATPTAGATTTLTAAQLCDNGLISWTAQGANSSATVPTAATLVADCLTAAGNSRDILVVNVGATSTFNFVASTGTTLYYPYVESGATTTYATAISSSTPALLRLTVTLASSTDSTVAAQVIKLTTR